MIGAKAEPEATEICASPSAIANKLVAAGTMLIPSTLLNPDALSVVSCPVWLTETPALPSWCQQKRSASPFCLRRPQLS